jgi:3-oxosteroid 1-dehydrogenase
MAGKRNVVIVGSGMGGLTAAITAAELGLDVVVLEKGGRVGGSCAYSGGQVWLGGNHVAARDGIADSLESTLTYVKGIAARDPASLDPVQCERWLRGAVDAARWLEERGVIRWEIIPGYSDYYWPDAPGSAEQGRYLTGAPFDGASLGADFDRLLIGPYFPIGITYGEMFGFGGMSSKTKWDWPLIERRRQDRVLTFGTGIAAALFKGALDRGVRVLTEHNVVELLAAGGSVTGVRCETPSGERRFDGPVILATGAHDWSAEYFERYTTIPAELGGSLTPPTVAGDAMGLAAPLGAAVSTIPPWAAPVLPGYRLGEAAWPGDHGYRACWEHALPHCFIVNRAGERFCEDDFHSPIIGAALHRDAAGALVNLPAFLVWDESHHAKYGLGRVMPGGDYPNGLVESAASLAELGHKLGIDGAALGRTASRFNTHARAGADPDFGRGSKPATQRFRGDGNNHPNPNLGPVETPPFFGMRLSLVNTGIASAGVRTDPDGRALDGAGRPIGGLSVVGEAAARTAAGVGYNSGYSLSRAMAFGHIAARRLAGANR